MKRRKRTSTRARTDRGVASWLLEHFRPSVTFDNPDECDDYVSQHGKPDSVGDLIDYAQHNATFWARLSFAF